MIFRSCVLVMVIVSTAATAHLCGAPTTGSQTSLREENARQVGEAPGPDARAQRVVEHQEKINRTVDEARRRGQEAQRQAAAARQGRENETDQRTELVVVGGNRYVVRVAAGLVQSQVDRLRTQLAEDVPPGFIQVEKWAAQARYNVSVGRFRTKARAVSVYQTLVERGYRFETLPEWGSVIEKWAGEGEPKGAPSTPKKNPTPWRSAVPAEASGVRASSPGAWRHSLTDLFTSDTAEALATGEAPESLEEYLDDLVNGTASVSLAFSEAPVERVLQSISQQTGVDIVARGRVARQPVSILVRNASLAEALRQLLISGSSHGQLFYAPAGAPETLELWDRQMFQIEVLPRFAERRVFDVRQIALGDAQRAVGSLLTPGFGSVVPIPSNNKLVVSDLPWVLRRVEELLGQIDRKVTSPAAPPGRETTY